MEARTHSGVRAGRPTGVDTRLPWWALVLPAVAFVVLFLLIAGPGEAQAVTGGDGGFGRLLEHFQQALVL
ncbi:hypothetical protein [Streptomyces sp. NPDC090025]|uniref:hypothetical protein n=1 Tax=Streptomyces sp. NPDC090025 TaxID=3365922 RepID=UPI003834A66F